MVLFLRGCSRMLGSVSRTGGARAFSATTVVQGDAACRRSAAGVESRQQSSLCGGCCLQCWICLASCCWWFLFSSFTRHTFCKMLRWGKYLREACHSMWTTTRVVKICYTSARGQTVPSVKSLLHSRNLYLIFERKVTFSLPFSDVNERRNIYESRM